MKIIVAGGRDFDDYQRVEVVMFEYDENIEVVSGGARGADALGERFAMLNRTGFKRFPADWGNVSRSDPRPLRIKTRRDGTEYNALAGHNRNEQMAEYADVLVAFWDGESRGTLSMIDLAMKHGLEVHVYQY